MSSLPFLEILYEDNHQIVVNKPAGILTQPDNTGQDSLEELIKAVIKKRDHKPGNVFLGVVHRIDKPVSGVVLLAKTSKALSRLNDALRQKQANKLYYAVVEGNFKHEEATLEHYLVHDDYYARVSSSDDPAAKLCRLHYRLINQHNGLACLEVNLETGRYHQIRAQLRAIGCPIIGDSKYGSMQHYKDHAIALHHAQLQMPHPITAALQTFEAPLPSSWPI